MLTLLSTRTNFLPVMMNKKFKILLLMVGLLSLQSCYTMLHPPATLPNTVTTVTSAPAIASSLGGSGYYGWDPYWEPALPFTSYHRGYGASYYNPYNYYDYRDPYYAPVYVVSESASPTPGRKFGRDDQQGGTRTRDTNSPSVSSGVGSKSPSVSSGNSTALPPPVKNVVVKPKPVAVIPVKPPPKRDVKSRKPSRETKPLRQEKVAPPKKRRETTPAQQDEPKKRERTRN